MKNYYCKILKKFKKKLLTIGCKYGFILTTVLLMCSNSHVLFWIYSDIVAVWHGSRIQEIETLITGIS